MTRRLAAVALATALAILSMGVAHGASGKSTILCVFQGAGSVSPPVTYKNGGVLKSYQFSGHSTCEGAASGFTSATGSGFLSCVGGSSIATINMPSGDSLRLPITHNLATFHGIGTVTSGPNAGQVARAAFEFHGLGALGCAGTGVTSASVNGVIQY